jgi:hypothetical protein
MQFLTECTKFLPDYILVRPTKYTYKWLRYIKFTNAQQAKNNPLLQEYKKKIIQYVMLIQQTYLNVHFVGLNIAQKIWEILILPDY